MEKTGNKVRKVLVELENGNILEFDKQVVIFAEDTMTDSEKQICDNNDIKMCVITSSSGRFLAEATMASLKNLERLKPGYDQYVIGKYLEAEDPIIEMLAKVLGI